MHQLLRKPVDIFSWDQLREVHGIMGSWDHGIMGSWDQLREVPRVIPPVMLEQAHHSSTP